MAASILRSISVGSLLSIVVKRFLKCLLASIPLSSADSPLIPGITPKLKLGRFCDFEFSEVCSLTEKLQLVFGNEVGDDVLEVRVGRVDVQELVDGC